MLRGSGQIEEAADFIFGLWKKEVPLGFDLILSILKNRKGATDSDYRLSIEPRFMRFTGGDPWSEPQPSRKKGFSLQ
jgi:replicative DNA helicase